MTKLMRSDARISCRIRLGTIGAAFLFGLSVLIPGAMAQEFNQNGHIVIADQFNNRVIEIDPATHKVVWQFGDGSSIWQYGQDGGVSGTGFDQLNTPVAATVLPNGHFLITDQANERIIEVNREKEIVFQYGVTGLSGSGFNELNNPNSAELLANGHILIADENNNRAIEVNRLHNIIHTYTAGNTVSGVAFASRLANGNTLLTDSNNNRIVEVDAHDNVVWQFVTTTLPGSIAAPLPTRAVRLRNGNTLISDQFNNQVIEVNHEKNAVVVFTQGKIGPVGGSGFDELNGPYDAKVVGDFTGLTPPPED